VDSTIGGALAARLCSGGVRVLGTSRRGRQEPDTEQLDLENHDVWRAPKVDHAFLCAAVTSIEACERDPETTRVINVDAPVSLAERLLDRGAHVTFLSTNLVFDGSRAARRVDEPTCPVTAYGRQKAEAEEKLLALSKRVSVLRLTKVLGPNHQLLTGWAEDLSAGRAIHPFCDVVIAPVSLEQTLDTLCGIAPRDASGVFQLSGDRDISYADAARTFASELGADPELVQPLAGRHRLVVAPATHTTLDTTSLVGVGIVAWPTDRTIRRVAAAIRAERRKA
jgi:dTDP-4-dehydrorhamnose reductase